MSTKNGIMSAVPMTRKRREDPPDPPSAETRLLDLLAASHAEQVAATKAVAAEVKGLGHKIDRHSLAITLVALLGAFAVAGAGLSVKAGWLSVSSSPAPEARITPPEEEVTP